ncbi:hypothetical protein BV25DRAFT_1889624 [Artomyces pyxidatus]|uniref:Uncharacterized protein n=1 Tax=Artomyces pyxidatus TaxID=48021 RepID=A0ACB8ST58_9AGAM|nr:hypothetical protein BV25DRAFT_1889624 [Artomyces pyxidatus]
MEGRSEARELPTESILGRLSSLNLQPGDVRVFTDLPADFNPLQPDGDEIEGPIKVTSYSFAHEVNPTITSGQSREASVNTVVNRRVHVPPKQLLKCSSCGGNESQKLYYCPCGEVRYCSTACQKSDWPLHKSACGPTTRIDIDKFYPFLAMLVELSRAHSAMPKHPATFKTVLNLPAPGTPPTVLPSGRRAVVVAVGGKPRDVPSPDPSWWPSAPNDYVRNKLWLRIIREGHLLPILSALCFALVSEIYTTTSQGKRGTPRLRLRYLSHPLADFGICRGTAKVTPQDTLAYVDVSSSPERVWFGQDPTEHYWLYFTAANGEEVYLDCGLFAFNMTLSVQAGAYADGLPMNHFPAWFRERLFHKETQELRAEVKRRSALRSAALADALASGHDVDVGVFSKFMKAVAGRDVGKEESELAKTLWLWQAGQVRDMVRSDAWKLWPTEVPLVTVADQGELDDFDDPNTDWAIKLREWKDAHKGIGKNRRRR